MSLISVIAKGLRNKVSPQGAMWVVMGNEACDLDSAVSAIAYSALLAEEGFHTTSVLNVARCDYPLKTEVQYWLNKHGVTKQQLVFRDEMHIEGDELHIQSTPLPQHQTLSAGAVPQTCQVSAVPLTSLHVCLVDHHVLAQKDLLLKPYVKVFIDHRPLEHGFAPGPGSTHSIVGSCCTLVTELLQQRTPHLLQHLAPLLHGCILLDCVNCLPAAGRATPRDEAALLLLETFMPPTDRSAVHQELTAAKASVEHLTSGQLLRRDAKMVCSVRVSGLTTCAKEFLARADALDALQESCDSAVASCSSDAPLSLTVVVGLRLDGDDPFRDLVVYSRNADLLQRACSSLQIGGEGVLQLQDHTSTLPAPTPSLRYFVQGNVRASRKQILPLLQRFVQQEAGC